MSPHQGEIGVACRQRQAPTRHHNNDVRPDFILTCGEVPVEWSSILVVGEHQSTGSNPSVSFAQLASYAEQIFIAQPFRVFVLGVLTSNTDPDLTFWRFDRCGAIGSEALNYSKSDLNLLTLSAHCFNLTNGRSAHGVPCRQYLMGDEHAYPVGSQIGHHHQDV
ncbi:hypothetical protein BGX38DRAFT_1281593 [Terfezia claveryi]|nr:hypothetical protein BGX38DRAFT_1281593 [Terfezia claveryi]